MSKVIKIKKGLDIPLTGEASARITQDTVTKTFGLVPDDFPGYKWKSAVKEGDTVIVTGNVNLAHEAPVIVKE